MDKCDMSYECKYWSCFSSICELSGKDCSGDNTNCPNYVDSNDDEPSVQKGE